jgi:hypothetical protein
MKQNGQDMESSKHLSMNEWIEKMCVGVVVCKNAHWNIIHS